MESSLQVRSGHGFSLDKQRFFVNFELVQKGLSLVLAHLSTGQSFATIENPGAYVSERGRWEGSGDSMEIALYPGLSGACTEFTCA
jgi:hypothetical protein